MVYETAVTAGAWTLPSTVTVCTTPTVELLLSCVAYDNVRHEDLWGLISTTHAALAKLGAAAPTEADAEPLVRDHEPAVNARKSLAHCDRILSMTDGSRTSALIVTSVRARSRLRSTCQRTLAPRAARWPRVEPDPRACPDASLRWHDKTHAECGSTLLDRTPGCRDVTHIIGKRGRGSARLR
jgi:hypothetical protein